MRAAAWFLVLSHRCTTRWQWHFLGRASLEDGSSRGERISLIPHSSKPTPLRRLPFREKKRGEISGRWIRYRSYDGWSRDQTSVRSEVEIEEEIVDQPNFLFWIFIFGGTLSNFWPCFEVYVSAYIDLISSLEYGEMAARNL